MIDFETDTADRRARARQRLVGVAIAAALVTGIAGFLVGRATGGSTESVAGAPAATSNSPSPRRRTR